MNLVSSFFVGGASNRQGEANSEEGGCSEDSFGFYC